jgi:Zn-dependent protease
VRNIFSTPDVDVFGKGANDNFEILKAWAGTSLAFAIAILGGRLLDFPLPTLGRVFLLSALTCGIGFVLHELAHRRVPRAYGAEAHFIANNGWLLISIVLAFTGFFIAAPGAVWHRGYLTPRQGGLIALAGPAVNLVLAVLFFALTLAAGPLGMPPWIGEFGNLGYRINAWLGLFNMIPFGPFDGAKVLAWSPLVFGITVAVGIVLVFVL